ncbi:MAG: hypothetical protein O3A00_11860 [Planctomycetota bacterium]|nr:hypothetical protein [Planctomycetota bacterium]
MANKDLPIGKEFTEDDLQREFFVINDQPYSNPALSYRILIPKRWGVDRIRAPSPELSTSHLKPLAVFGSEDKDGNTLQIQIQAVELVREVRAADWIRQYAVSTERRMRDLKDLSTHFADSLMTFEIQRIEYTARSSATIHGNMLFFVMCLSPSAHYVEVESQFGLAISSFRVTNPMPGNVEEQTTIEMGEFCTFHCPQSWDIESRDEIAGMHLADLASRTEDGDLCGAIRIKTIESDGEADQSEMSLTERAWVECEESGVTIGSELGRPLIQLDGDRFHVVNFVISEATLVTNAARQEVWICELHGQHHKCVLSMLTPSRQGEFFYWAVNRRAFEIVLSSCD